MNFNFIILSVFFNYQMRSYQKNFGKILKRKNNIILLYSNDYLTKINVPNFNGTKSINVFFNPIIEFK